MKQLGKWLKSLGRRKTRRTASQSGGMTRPALEALEDRVALSRLVAVSETGGSSYDVSSAVWLKSIVNGEDVPIEVSDHGSGQVGLNAVASSKEHPLMGIYASSFVNAGMFSTFYEVFGDSTVGSFDLQDMFAARQEEGRAGATAAVQLQIVPDGPETDGSPVLVRVSVMTTKTEGGRVMLRVGDLTGAGEFTAQIGDTVSISLDLAASLAVSDLGTALQSTGRARVRVELVPSIASIAGVSAKYDTAPSGQSIPEHQGWADALAAGVAPAEVAAAIYTSAEHRGRQVDALYAAYLGRAADSAGRAFWVSQLQAGMSEADVARRFLLSEEYQATHVDNVAFLAGLYQSVFGRTADAPGMAAWQAALRGSASRAAVVDGILTSEEAYVRVVRTGYADYLGRSPEDAGLAFWVARLQSGWSQAQLSQAMLGSDEFVQRTRGSVA